MKSKILIHLFFLGILCQVSFAKVVLPKVFADNMVLQRNTTVKIWGWGSPSEEVTVITGWDNKSYTTKTGNDAKWELSVDTQDAGGPYSLQVKGNSNEIIIQNLLLGEVWLCSGQSNMEWSAHAGLDNKEEEIKNANYPEIRFFSVDKRTSDAPQDDLSGNWTVCTPETMPNFSAVAYFFAKRLQGELHVPIGVINSSWGASSSEVWTPEYVFEENPDLAESSKLIGKNIWVTERPSTLYNAMIAPLTSFKISGAIWYQGESNTANAETYEKQFTQMIASWRKQWGYEFPFYFVQIAPFKYGDNYNGVLVRDAQRRASMYPKSGMALTSDICTVDDIHPKNKQDVGLRLANVALKKYYHAINTEVDGPLFKEMNINGSKVQVLFDHAEGLYVKDKKVTDFEIAGDDGIFYPAQAKIKGDIVIVSSKKVQKPAEVRFEWGNTILPNLFNNAGLPASSFISNK